MDQGLVAGGTPVAAQIVVAEGHLDLREMVARPGPLGLEAQLNPLLRLHLDGEAIGVLHRLGRQQGERRATELDHDLGVTRRQAFAGAHVERHVGPAPVVDMQLQRSESLGGGSGRDMRLVAVAGHGFTAQHAGTVLPAHRIAQQGFLLRSAHRPQHLHLFVADFLVAERRRWLHRNEAQHLEDVVLNDVAQGTLRVVVAPAVLDTQGFGDGDLHMIDVVAIPDRLEDPVQEPEAEKVLHRLLAEVVVDPVNLRFVHAGEQFAIESARRREVAAEGLFDHHAKPAAVGGTVTSRRNQAGPLQTTRDRRELIRRHREIHQHVAPGSMAGVHLLESLLQPLIGIGIFGTPGQIVQTRRVGAEKPDIGAVFAVPADRRRGTFAESFVAQTRAGNPDHRELVRQEAVAMQVVEGGNELALREIAGSAEDHHHAGRRRGGGGGWERVHARPSVGTETRV